MTTMTTPTQLRRLRALRATLARLTPEQCNMENWFAQINPRLPVPARRARPGCGTTACLAGWAALLFAPTINAPKDAGSVAEDWGLLFVPETWARRRGLDISREVDPIRRKGVKYVAVGAREIGHWALGDDAARLFIPGDGRARDYHSTYLNDQDWMITKLTELIDEVSAARR